MNRLAITGVALTVVLLLVLGTLIALVVVDKPQIRSVDSEWGTITEERSEIVTGVSIDNPRLVRIGNSLADVRYTVSMNQIEVATGTNTGVPLEGRTDVVTLSTWIHNERIPDWWVTHINNNETTTATFDLWLVQERLGIDVQTTQLSRHRTLQTNLLGPLQQNQSRQVTAFNRTIFVVNETEAAWGQATENRTPINGSVTMTNTQPVALPVTEFQYTVRMNEIVVGQGTAGRWGVLRSGATRTLPVNASIENQHLDEWWVTHLQNNETTTMTVTFNATVRYRGEKRELPLDFISYNRTFETDLLGAPNTSESPSGDSAPPDTTAPAVISAGCDGSVCRSAGSRPESPSVSTV